MVEQGIAKRRQVEIGQQSDAGIAILQGLNKNELVVNRGNEALRDNQAVSIIQP